MQKKLYRCEECKDMFEVQANYIKHYLREHTDRKLEDADLNADYRGVTK